MSAISQFYGNDIDASSNGSLMLVDGTDMTKQRILRRLMTNPGDYVHHTEYGAGLPRWIGMTLDVPKITANIRGQMLLEDGVAKTPEPAISVEEIPDGISCSISYTDADTGTTELLYFNVKA
jgi:phage baseplate assembly protein W